MILILLKLDKSYKFEFYCLLLIYKTAIYIIFFNTYICNSKIKVIFIIIITKINFIVCIFIVIEIEINY